MTGPVEGAAPVTIDNRALDGFIDRFREAGCRDVDCDECGWCEKFAREAVHIDPRAQAQSLAAYHDLFQALDGGSMWRYLPHGQPPDPSLLPIAGAGCGCGNSCGERIDEPDIHAPLPRSRRSA